MTSLGSSIEEANFAISGGRLKLELGAASATIPVGRITDVIRALEGIRFIIEGGGSSVAEAPRAAAASLAPAVAPRPATDSAAKTAIDKSGGKRKRRSRKRVGDALERWMESNPGWHSESALLDAVRQNNMSDADPKRALKIALGKQAGGLFENDSHGRWKLRSDPTAVAAVAPAKARRERAPAAAPKAAAKAAPAARGERQRRVKAKSETAATEPSAEPAPAEDATVRSAVLVKRGQNRKAATLSPSELEARRQATEAIDSRRKTRWSRVSSSELERARKNLLGLGPKG